jgi:D-3-phosphoglycerate dehydrogenase
MEVLAYDPYAPPPVGEGVRTVELDALLAEADFVSLHARATPANENLFDTATFGWMKPGAYFVNTARETLVDESALDSALSDGQLGGAALDVVRPRRAGGRHPLLRHENVVITPHIGGATYETLRRGVAMLAEDLGRFDAGKPLERVANPEAVSS